LEAPASAHLECNETYGSSSPNDKSDFPVFFAFFFDPLFDFASTLSPSASPTAFRFPEIGLELPFDENDKLGVCIFGFKLDDALSSGCLEGNALGSGSGANPFSENTFNT